MINLHSFRIVLLNLPSIIPFLMIISCHLQFPFIYFFKCTFETSKKCYVSFHWILSLSQIISYFTFYHNTRWFYLLVSGVGKGGQKERLRYEVILDQDSRLLSQQGQERVLCSEKRKNDGEKGEEEGRSCALQCWAIRAHCVSTADAEAHRSAPESEAGWLRQCRALNLLLYHQSHPRLVAISIYPFTYFSI